MKSGIKVLSIASGLIILIGILILVMGFAFGGTLESDRTEKTTIEAEGTFTKIDIKASSANIIIKKSDTDKTYAICDSSKKISYELKAESGTLCLKEIDNRKWYDHIGFFFGWRDAVLYLPEENYASLSIDISSGNIKCEDEIFSFAEAELMSTSGSIKYSAKAERLSANVSSGSIYIEKLNAQSIRLNAVSGSINFTRCDGKEITMECTSGSIKGSLLTGKIFDIKTSSGSSSYPDMTIGGGTFKATTSSGNVKITVEE